MKMADILRDLADLIDQQGSKGNTDEIGRSLGSDGGDVMANKTMQRMEPVPEPDQDTGDDGKMVPPLQAKLEILKKSEGLPNVYDSCGESDDELAMIRKNAGLTAAQHEAAEDNDMLG